MDQIQLPPDPLTLLLQGLNVFAQSLQQSQCYFQQQQKKMQQVFNQKVEQILNVIGDSVTINEAVQSVVQYSESEGVEVSGIMFYDEEEDEVVEVHIDNVGDLTSVDLDMVMVAPMPLKTYSFHTHPRYGITTPSQADLEVIETRVWEQGHCIFTTIDGGIVANCIEV